MGQCGILDCVIRRPLPFYRSVVTRIVFIITGLSMAWALGPFGPALWHETPSLEWLHSLIPWSVLAGVFLIHSLLLWWGSLPASILADWMGVFMYGAGLIALVRTVSVGRPTNPYAITACLLAVTLYYMAAKAAQAQRAFEKRADERRVTGTL